MEKLEIKNLNIKTGDREVIKNVSFVVKSGEVHILMGPNGSGKSTLLNGIFGHPNNEISGGKIKLSGKDITNLAVEEKVKRGLFLSLQQLPKIEGVTLLQCLYVAAKNKKENKDISIFDFHKKMKEKADEIGINDTFLLKNINSELSGGEKKQTEILQLLAISPKFAFLDEIDSGVDVVSLKKVFAGIEYAKALETGFILVTHNTKILQYIKPNRVHIMKDGSIVKSGEENIIKEIEKDGF